MLQEVGRALELVRLEDRVASVDCVARSASSVHGLVISLESLIASRLAEVDLGPLLQIRLVRSLVAPVIAAASISELGVIDHKTIWVLGRRVAILNVILRHNDGLVVVEAGERLSVASSFFVRSKLLVTFHVLNLLVPPVSEPLGIIGDNSRSEALVSLESSLRQVLHLLVLLNPLVLHLVLEVLADLEILELLEEDSLDQDLVDVLEVHLLVISLVSLYFVCREDSDDVFILY